MTDNEIIKALECCLDTSPLTCKDCPMFNVTNSTMVCSKIVTKFALDLINRQQEENERLQKVQVDHTKAVLYEFADRLQIRCIKQDGCLWSSDIGAELKEILEEE